MSLDPAPSRDPCFWCGVPGFLGCDHWAPCPPVFVERPRVDNGAAPRHNIGGLTKNGVKPGFGPAPPVTTGRYAGGRRPSRARGAVGAYRRSTTG